MRTNKKKKPTASEREEILGHVRQHYKIGDMVIEEDHCKQGKYIVVGYGEPCEGCHKCASSGGGCSNSLALYGFKQKGVSSSICTNWIINHYSHYKVKENNDSKKKKRSA